MSNLKEECHISMDDKVIRIRTGNTDLWLLYSALTEIHRKDGLIFFFAQKEFWAVPERVLGGEQKAQQWFGCLTAKCREGREARIPLAVMEPQEDGFVLQLHQDSGPVYRCLQGPGHGPWENAEAAEGGAVSLPLCWGTAAGIGRGWNL